jgi:hypothetical protein
MAGSRQGAGRPGARNPHRRSARCASAVNLGRARAKKCPLLYISILRGKPCQGARHQPNPPTPLPAAGLTPLPPFPARAGGKPDAPRRRGQGGSARASQSDPPPRGGVGYTPAGGEVGGAAPEPPSRPANLTPQPPFPPRAGGRRWRTYHGRAILPSPRRGGVYPSRGRGCPARLHTSP